ncbi:MULTISPECIES: NAD(P)-dependent oxidoreductase [unclassified Wenzhouxiangella]|uniref:NAD(P)-dependent oxidoreductase n=1 Tax=unclassified Wenzhouxiangella TaxID=2613841 RepID=UPI000E328D52|nr:MULTISPECIES: NAD(P)-binding oxidoreductase [unclassified Wenzhouxiangella]RFF27258.1 NAD(P)-dependent oxidoreductase [Wenzhouxiangella sp. 15181]RFP69284.1 NAD(P)-dependent oxidoreductase [Wenzhouxiangella sp. 15190]
MTDKTVLIMGASKGIGRRAVDYALERGCTVRAMARGAEKIEIEHDRLEKFSGDATERDDVHRALEGTDAVILALGVPSGPTRLMQPVTLFSRSTEILVAQMEANGPKRLVVVTGFGAGESRHAMNAVEELGHRLLLGRAYADKDVQEEIVERSSLDWTIVRPTILTNGPATGEYQVLITPESWRNGLISRADVAEFLVTRALDRENLHEGPVLVY